MPARPKLVALCLLAVFGTGCGSSSNTTVSLRIVQASPDAPASKILIDGTSVASNAVYGNNTGYQSVKVGSRHIQLIPVSGSSAIFDQSISVSSTADQTLLLAGPASAIKPALLNDGGTTSTTGDGYVRVINASTGISHGARRADPRPESDRAGARWHVWGIYLYRAYRPVVSRLSPQFLTVVYEARLAFNNTFPAWRV